ncbi:MAG: hypothetical protein R3C03_16305 [Pirellulaceae bacterium]
MERRRRDEDIAELKEAFRTSPFAFLINVAPDVTNELLRDEHPKNIAIVLANLPPQVANEQVKLLEPVLRVSVVKRICQLESEDSAAETSQLAF